jgi:hypothetical protein
MRSRRTNQRTTAPLRPLRDPGRAAALPALTAMLALWAGALRADSPPGPLVAAQAHGDGGQQARDTPLSPAEQAERRRTATAMVYLVVGIGVVGITLAVLIVLGGHRLRKRVRSRAGRSPDLDPLWYLRSPETRGGTSRAPTAGEGATTGGDDRENEP